MSRRLLLSFTTAAVLLTAAAAVAGPAARFLEREPNLWLETLDWGGEGVDVLLLAGMNHTAHVWEGFAPRLAADARVTAFTRRGWGASSHAAAGYTPERLARDVLAVCDSLGLDRPVLVGHSIAGAEMAEAARLRPGGFRGFVFLDAAYDHSLLPQLADLAEPPRQPGPRAEELASPEGVREYVRRTRGYYLPDAELTALHAFTAAGHLKDMNHSRMAESLIVSALEPPRFEDLDAPAVAVYARPTVASLYPAHREFDPEARRAAEARVRLLRQMVSAQAATFEAAVPAAAILVWNGSSHHMHLTEPTRTLTVVRGFLAGLPAAEARP